LEDEITQEEIKKAITGMPKLNVPSSDGFIGAFFNKCWDIMKGEITSAILQLSQLSGGTFNLLNTAHIMLLPKKEQSGRIRDYRPISLFHNIAKIFSKVLANMLAPQLSEMV
jgi:hypothetical protein